MKRKIFELISIIIARLTGKDLYECCNCKTKNVILTPYKENTGLGSVAGFCKNCGHPIWY